MIAVSETTHAAVLAPAKATLSIVPRDATRDVASDVTRDATRAPTSERPALWREVAESLVHVSVEMPIISRLFAGQVVLGLGVASLLGARALHARARAAAEPSAERLPARVRRGRLRMGATVLAGLWCGWAALAIVTRMRALPAVYLYGHALRHYFVPHTRAA